MLKITYYLDVISSWCFYAEENWASLKTRYKDDVKFQWKVALIPESGLPKTAEEEEWYYRRSGWVTHWQNMFTANWVEPGRTDYLPPNAVAEACKDFGITGDEARLALAKATMIDGLQIGEWETCVDVVQHLLPEVEPHKILEAARSDEVLMRIQQGGKEFNRLQVDQRPTFQIVSEIGDKAVFSGLIHKAPLEATIDAMISDVRAYRSFHSHFGQIPPVEEEPETGDGEEDESES